MQVYVAPEVADIVALHPYLVEDNFRAQPVREQIFRQAKVVKTAHARGDRRVRMHLMSWWPGAAGLSLDSVMDGPFSDTDALLTLAREYEFQNWAEVEALGDRTTSSAFELALDLMLAGEFEKLKEKLEAEPDLVKAQSAYGHRATLLHYLGANGVESHRQRTPLNAVALAKLLINLGADTRAEANMYGGGQTALALASTSAHPHNAGVSDELNRVLSGGTV